MNMDIVRVRLSLLWTLLLCAECAVIAEDASAQPEPTEMLEQYRASLDALNRSAIVVTTELVVSGAIKNPKSVPDKFVKTYTYFRDGNRRAIDSVSTQYYDGPGKVRTSGTQLIKVRDGWLRFDRQPEIKVSRRGWFYPGEEKETIREFLVHLGGARVLEGWTFAYGPAHLADLLGRSESLSVQAEVVNIDGHDCYLVEAHGEGYGDYKLWLDSNAGYLPRMISIVKRTGDMNGNRTVGSPFVKTGQQLRLGPSRYPTSPATHVTNIIDQIQIDEIDGIPVIKSCRIVQGTLRETGEIVLFTTQYVRETIDLNPDFEALGAFEPNVENPIIQENTVGGGEFTWKDGRMVPREDLAAD